jgi:hypothetical protein
MSGLGAGHDGLPSARGAGTGRPRAVRMLEVADEAGSCLSCIYRGIASMAGELRNGGTLAKLTLSRLQ